MTNYLPAFNFATLNLASLIVVSALTSSPALAANVTGGALILNIDRNALIAGTSLDNYPDAPTPEFQICCRPSIYLEEFYDASAASARTFVQIRDDNTPDLYDLINDEIPAAGLVFAVNGTSVPNPGGRANQPTTFSFDPQDIFGTASGGIGLGGVMRFRVDVSPPTNRVNVGDMTLEYHADYVDNTIGRSGWLLVNHIGFEADAFELFDVTTNLTGDSLSLNGNLGFGWGFDHVGSWLGHETNMRIGTFSFQTAVVPLPSAVWMFVSGLLGLLGGNVLKRKVTI